MTEKRIKIFFIPFFTVIRKYGKFVVKMFGITLLKMKRVNDSKIKVYVLGIPLIKIKQKKLPDDDNQKQKLKIYFLSIPVFSVKTVEKQVLKSFVHDEDAIKFLSRPIQAHTVLMVELNGCHGECLPGMAKYFLDLGYRVDVMLSPLEFSNNPFANFEHPDLTIFSMPQDVAIWLLSTDIVERYAHLYLNSDFLYSQKINGECMRTYDAFKGNLKSPQGKILMLCHHINKIIANKRLSYLALQKFSCTHAQKYTVVNAHYFGDFHHDTLGKKIKFVVVGQIESTRKNHSILFDAVRKLLQRGVSDFVIDVVARYGTISVPKELAPYFEFKGRLNYHDMYQVMNEADFYLPLFDPKNPEHDRYLTSGSSGSYQLIYGFKKPCVICRKFMCELNRFDDSNAIGYDSNDQLSEAMAQAILMKPEEYRQKVNNLAKLSADLQAASLLHLKGILKEAEPLFEPNTFVSLGENCFNRTVLTRHHLKASKEQGEMSCPFDLCVSLLHSILWVLENDFADFFDNLTYSFETTRWIDTKYGFQYNHDQDCLENDKEKLIERYRGRIENFREMLRGKKKYFVISCAYKPQNLNDVNKIYEYLCRKCETLPCLMYFDLSADGVDASILDRHIYYRHIAHPYRQFGENWWKCECYSSEAGQAFEEKYIDAVEENVRAEQQKN
jgi:hypothetical protein